MERWVCGYNMNIPKIDAIGFDWDGTLVDSMIDKAKYFADSIIEFYPEVKENKKDIEISFLQNGGRLRNIQLQIIQKMYNIKSLSNDEYEKWSELFTSLYIDKKLPLFDDTIKVLEKLEKKYKLFLSSSVPHDHLNKTLKLYPITQYFELILGTKDNGKFKKGVPHLTYVSKKLGIPLEKISFIGDGYPDVVGANESGCFSIGKFDSRIPGSRERLEEKNPKIIIEKLEELLAYFNG